MNREISGISRKALGSLLACRPPAFLCLRPAEAEFTRSWGWARTPRCWARPETVSQRSLFHIGLIAQKTECCLHPKCHSLQLSTTYAIQMVFFLLVLHWWPTTPSLAWIMKITGELATLPLKQHRKIKWWNERRVVGPPWASQVAQLKLVLRRCHPRGSFLFWKNYHCYTKTGGRDTGQSHSSSHVLALDWVFEKTVKREAALWIEEF